MKEPETPSPERHYQELVELLQAFALEMELVEEANKETAPARGLKLGPHSVPVLNNTEPTTPPPTRALSPSPK